MGCIFVNIFEIFRSIDLKRAVSNVKVYFRKVQLEVGRLLQGIRYTVVSVKTFTCHLWSRVALELVNFIHS